MRHTTTATSISWIPSEAVKGMTKLPFETGVAHYDPTPPEQIAPTDLDRLRDADRFRFANQLEAWIDVDDGRITGSGCRGRGLIGSTTMQLGKRATSFAAVGLPDVRPDPQVGDGWVRFTQTAGGRTGVPTPRHVSRPPYVQVTAPLAWTTLSLTLHADGRSDSQITGASPFPRHWLYDGNGDLVAKSGLIDFRTWYRTAFGKHSPWGDEDTPALVTAVETALERTLSERVMREGAAASIEKLKPGRDLIRQGDEGTDLFLLLDGVLAAEVDGRAVGELGPGAFVGERAVLEGGRRTATLRALTPCRVARVDPTQIDREALAELAQGHRREDMAPDGAANDADR